MNVNGTGKWLRMTVTVRTLAFWYSLLVNGSIVYCQQLQLCRPDVEHCYMHMCLA